MKFEILLTESLQPNNGVTILFSVFSCTIYSFTNDIMLLHPPSTPKTNQEFSGQVAALFHFKKYYSLITALLLIIL